jgi:16S rRNA (guanine527-N7)-methyltransferase
MPPEVAALLAEQHIELEPGDSEKLGRYLAMLLLANQSINLTAVTDPAEGWRRHLADALMLIPLVASFEPTEFIDAEADPDAAMAALRRTGDPAAPAAIPAMRVVDVGTGGGLPGIPLAIALPDVRFTLIEATGKKVQFLRLVRKRLGLMNVDVVQARAEAAGQDRKNHREIYDIAIARAVGSLAVLVELAGPLVKPGGVMLAVKGEKAQQEVTEAEEAIAKIGLSFDQIVPTATSRVVVLPKIARTPKTYPRRDGEPSRVPIGITREREAPEPRPDSRSRPPRGGGPRRS